MKQCPYTIKCINCGKEWHYEQFTCYMQKINAFHCSCGGKLVVIQDDEEEKTSKVSGSIGKGTSEA